MLKEEVISIEASKFRAPKYDSAYEKHGLLKLPVSCL